jgi:hypothetical protein
MSKPGVLPDQLRNYLVKGRCVAFVGAGFSRICGMPDWRGLMDALLEFCRQQCGSNAEMERLEACSRILAGGQLINAADDLRSLLRPAEFSEFLRRQFDRQRFLSAPQPVRERMESRLRNIVAAPWAGIITTNYDQLIDDFCTDWFQCNGDDRALGYVLSRNERFYVRLHSAAWRSKIVLTSEDYYKVYLSNPEIPTIQPFLRAAMISHQIVFIGCSLEDRLLDLRKEIFQAFDGEIPVAYALLPDNQSNRDRVERLAKFAIRPILYPVELGPSPEHQAVDTFLAEVAAVAASAP